MCVILYKPKKIDIPNEDILKRCFINNRDGAGYTFVNHNNVIVKKGYKDFKSFYNELLNDYKKYNLKNHNLIVHFRIGTSGGLSAEKTQPFKITSNVKELNKIYIKNKKSSIVHNGIFNNFTYNDKLSDTQNYIKDFLNPLLKSNIKDKDAIIDQTLKTSKLAILNNNDIVNLYGEFTRYKGVYYSNNSFNNYEPIKNSIVFNFKNNKREELRRYNAEYFNKQISAKEYLKYYNYNWNNDRAEYLKYYD